jgi:hypothetical protein
LFAFKITLSCRIFRFSCIGVLGLPCELSWHLVPVLGSKARYFPIGFTLAIKKELRIVVKILSLGLQDPRSRTGSIFKKTHYSETRKSKKSTQKQMFKSKRTRFVYVGTSDLSIDTKKHMCKSRETIYLYETIYLHKSTSSLF